LKNRPIFYDTDCLACFLIIGECSILCEMFSKIIIPRVVYNEFFNESTPIMIKNNLKSLIDDGFVEVKDMIITSREYSNYRCIESGLWSDNGKRVGKGEASVIAFAIENEGIVASNNLSDVKHFTDKYNLPLLTTAIILGKAFEMNIINETQGNILWEKMLKRNRNLPDNSFSSYYQNRYETDCNDFLKV